MKFLWISIYIKFIFYDQIFRYPARYKQYSEIVNLSHFYLAFDYVDTLCRRLFWDRKNYYRVFV